MVCMMLITDGVVIGCSKLEHLVANVAACEEGPLDASMCFKTITCIASSLCSCKCGLQIYYSYILHFASGQPTAILWSPFCLSLAWPHPFSEEKKAKGLVTSVYLTRSLGMQLATLWSSWGVWSQMLGWLHEQQLLYSSPLPHNTRPSSAIASCDYLVNWLAPDTVAV